MIGIGYVLVISLGGGLVILSKLENMKMIDGDLVKILLLLTGYGTIAYVVLSLFKMFV